MSYTREEEDVIVLDSFEEFTYKNKYILLGGLENTSPDFDKNAAALIKSLSEGVYNKLRGKFKDPACRAKVFENLAGKGVECITYFSELYPENLRQIPNPPIVLYCKGNKNLLRERCFAIVGSRRTPRNILEISKKVAGEVSGKFTVVSGMADGADSAAVEGALGGGKIISVLAYGFDYVYPSVNANLIKEVEKRGLLISEYPPDIPPRSYQFPVRNRIIAGLSDAVLVVSAGKKSGALITAYYATEYGRQVMAFPYGMGVTYGEGCNGLIKKGADLVENTLDIFSAFGIDYKPPEKSAELSGEERAVYEIIKQTGEAFAPEIAQKLGKQPYQLIPVLSSLEIKGLVARLGGNRYAAT